MTRTEFQSNTVFDGKRGRRANELFPIKTFIHKLTLSQVLLISPCLGNPKGTRKGHFCDVDSPSSSVITFSSFSKRQRYTSGNIVCWRSGYHF